MISSSLSVSAIGRLDVGSSRITSRAVEAQRLGDLHHLLLGERQAGHRGVGGEIGAEPIEKGLHHGVQPFGVDDASGPYLRGSRPM